MIEDWIISIILSIFGLGLLFLTISIYYDEWKRK